MQRPRARAEPLAMQRIADVRDVILRDGTTLRLRSPETADADGVLDFFQQLSERSVYQRFHGFPSLGKQLVEPFLDPDWEDRGSLIGTLSADGGGERVVALARIGAGAMATSKSRRSTWWSKKSRAAWCRAALPAG